MRPQSAYLPLTKNNNDATRNRIVQHIQLWQVGELSSEVWGWKCMLYRMLVVITTIAPVALEAVINLIFQLSTTSCGNKCGTKKTGITIGENHKNWNALLPALLPWRLLK